MITNQKKLIATSTGLLLVVSALTATSAQAASKLRICIKPSGAISVKTKCSTTETRIKNIKQLLGAAGAAGAAGLVGADGAKGDTGDQGAKGDTGATGASGFTVGEPCEVTGPTGRTGVYAYVELGNGGPTENIFIQVCDTRP